MTPSAPSTDQPSPAGPGPFSGLKVLDLSSYLAAPYGCTLLADLGAQVIKIEAPAGDMMRHYPSSLPQESRAFLGTNRNKRAIVLDLKQEAALQAFHRMVADADVVVHNFRPAVPARLKIDYDTLREIRPDLIYCSVTGYGENGPLKDHGGFDQVLQSMTGICTFQPDLDGTPQLIRGSIVDYYTSALVAYSISAALFHRAMTGEGQTVSCSLLRTALTMQAGRFVWARDEPRETVRDLNVGKVTGIHPTKQGLLYISAHSTHFWAALCELLDLGELGTDPRYDTMRKRAELADELLPRMHAALARHTAQEWKQIFGERVPCAPVQAIEDMFDHPQVLAEDLVAELPHPQVGSYRTMTKPVRLGKTPGPAPFAAPTFGQHSDQILAEHGYTDSQIRAMRATGALQ